LAQVSKLSNTWTLQQLPNSFPKVVVMPAARTPRFAEDSECELLTETAEVPSISRPHHGSKGGFAAGVVALLLLAGYAAVSRLRAPLHSASGSAAQLQEIVVAPPRPECAKIASNCLDSKCCKVSGYTCFELHPGYAKCMKECTPGVDGTCLSRAMMTPAEHSTVSLSATTLFCWSVYTENRGTTAKPNHELEVLRTSLFLGTSIFGCEAWKVYSDVSVWLSPGKQYTVKVDDKDGDFHFAKRKLTGSWVNSGTFIQVWEAIKEEGIWEGKDWTVKVDADTVFLPSRLRSMLTRQPVTSSGIYLENCKYVNYGFFGSLEVFSHQAVATYVANIDDCKNSLNWKGSEKATGWQPWGEDLFAQRCMDLHGVDKVEAFGITADGGCEAFRPEGQKKNKHWKPDCATTSSPAMHPFKEPSEYFDCLKATQR
jgi:hypothetical protein